MSYLGPRGALGRDGLGDPQVGDLRTRGDLGRLVLDGFREAHPPLLEGGAIALERCGGRLDLRGRAAAAACCADASVAPALARDLVPPPRGLPRRPSAARPRRGCAPGSTSLEASVSRAWRCVSNRSASSTEAASRAFVAPRRCARRRRAGFVGRPRGTARRAPRGPRPGRPGDGEFVAGPRPARRARSPAAPRVRFVDGAFLSRQGRVDRALRERDVVGILPRPRRFSAACGPRAGPPGSPRPGRRRAALARRTRRICAAEASSRRPSARAAPLSPAVARQPPRGAASLVIGGVGGPEALRVVSSAEGRSSSPPPCASWLSQRSRRS